VRRLLVTVPSSPSLVTLLKEALSPSETSVLTRATRRSIPEDAIPQYVITISDNSEKVTVRRLPLYHMQSEV
jgi:hypothetical protein